jgi:hypothetical protein
MHKMMIVGTVITAALWAGCSKDKDPATGTSSTGTTEPGTNNGAKTGLDVSVTPSGQADVYVTDDKGNRVNGDGATGRVELPDGSSVPLTPSDGGAHMTAPLGGHDSHAKHGCDATVRVTPRNGPERVARLDMCRGMGRGRMGPGETERGGEMGHGMEHGATPGSGMGEKPGHGS